MVVDFHTHVFPDKLAPKAMKSLIDAVEDVYVVVSDGTVAGLLQNMDEWNIAKSVILPVITKPSQTRNANEFAAKIANEHPDRLVCFGGVHPHSYDYKEDIDFVVSNGLRGLKFHAEYQDFMPDDEKMLRIYDYALSRGLIIIHHAGYDPAFPPPLKSSPRQFKNVSDALGLTGKPEDGIFIAAHLGGHAQWDDVEKYLPGTGIYLDTSMGFEYFPHDQFLRIVESVGADKILFASDAPWSNAKTEIEHLRGMPLEDKVVNAILGGNALRILGS